MNTTYHPVWKKCLGILFFTLFCSLWINTASALEATGSEYAVGQFSTTVQGSGGSGIENSASVESSIMPSDINISGASISADVGIVGEAVPSNNSPIITSESISPKTLKQGNSTTIQIYSVYTTSVTATITRPDGSADAIDFTSLGSQIYSNTGTVGRYNIIFEATGNSIVQFNDYFDVESASVVQTPTPPKTTHESSGGGSAYTELYVDLSYSCADKTLTVQSRDKSSSIQNVRVSILHDNITMTITTRTDPTSLILSDGEFIINTYKMGYKSEVINYSADCPDDQEPESNDVTGNSANDDMSTNDSNAAGKDYTAEVGINDNDQAAKDVITETPGQFGIMDSGQVLIIIGFTLIVAIFSMMLVKYHVAPKKKSIKRYDEAYDAGKIYDTRDTKKYDAPDTQNIPYIHEAIAAAPKTETPVEANTKMLIEEIERIEKEKAVSQETPRAAEFVLCTGERIKDVAELANILEDIDDSTFYYHVTPYKNDFATWIYNALGQKELAEEIGPIKERSRIIEILRARVR